MSISIPNRPYPPPDIPEPESTWFVSESIMGNWTNKIMPAWFNKLTYRVSYQSYQAKQWRAERMAR